jgi:two-component system OmpR family response regulator
VLKHLLKFISLLIMEQNSDLRILLVEDDQNLGYLLKNSFEQKGFIVSLSPDGKHGFKIFRQQRFNLCILDIMLPFKDGFTLAQDIKKLDNSMPIIFLTSRSLEMDKVHGFQIGCDDYITKPFSVMELLLRVNAVLKRSNPQEFKSKPVAYMIGKYQFDYDNRMLIFPDQRGRTLSMKEAELLRLFCEHGKDLIHRQYMMNKIWGNDDYFVAKSMDVFITRLRKLLKQDPLIEIQNVYGTGFKLVVHD